MPVSSHRRNAATELADLGGLQNGHLVSDLARCLTEHLDVERHILNVEVGPNRLHVEESRGLLIDAPQEAALTWPRVDGRIHDPHHWKVGARAVQRLGHD